MTAESGRGFVADRERKLSKKMLSFWQLDSQFEKYFRILILICLAERFARILLFLL